MTEMTDVGYYRLFGAGGSPYSVKAGADDLYHFILGNGSANI